MPGWLSSDQETADPLLFPPFLPSFHLLSESPSFCGFFKDNVVTKKLAVFSYEAVHSTSCRFLISWVSFPFSLALPTL